MLFGYPLLHSLIYVLYISGGRVDTETSLASVECYDPAVDMWEEVAPLSTPRRAAAVCAHSGKLYAMGGSGIMVKVI